jgi:hypothetical protein
MIQQGSCVARVMLAAMTSVVQLQLSAVLLRTAVLNKEKRVAALQVAKRIHFVAATYPTSVVPMGMNV